MSLGLGRIERTKNTAELIADALRSAILQGKLVSGQALKQDEIAAEFQVSKIPVREALVQLQAEGLVTLIPSRGALVSKLSYEDVDEIYSLRLALEPMALRRAIPNMTPSDFVQLEMLLNKIDSEKDLTKWAELNWEFHSALYDPAQMPRLIRITKELHNNVARYLLFNYLDENYLERSQAQHRAILNECRSGNMDKACQLLVEHLGDPVQVFASQIK